jgi:hypothetical protein
MIVLGFRRARGHFRFGRSCGLRKRSMNAAFVSGERKDDQNEHYDQSNALFIFRELKNPQQMFYFLT